MTGPGAAAEAFIAVGIISHVRPHASTAMHGIVRATKVGSQQKSYMARGPAMQDLRAELRHIMTDAAAISLHGTCTHMGLWRCNAALRRWGPRSAVSEWARRRAGGDGASPANCGQRSSRMTVTIQRRQLGMRLCPHTHEACTSI